MGWPGEGRKFESFRCHLCVGSGHTEQSSEGFSDPCYPPRYKCYFSEG
ncbi:hypothetical protein A2U01_0013586, partial [Trifolium medium]|nr:hypothetical protein [Trifolium medium]